MKTPTFTFNTLLVDGIIEGRKSQFTMIVSVGGNALSCYCPTTGRIGDIDLGGRPCLLSELKQVDECGKRTLLTNL